MPPCLGLPAHHKHGHFRDTTLAGHFGGRAFAADDFHGLFEFRKSAGHGNQVAHAGHGSQGRVQSAAVLDEILETADGHNGFDKTLALGRLPGASGFFTAATFLAIFVVP